MNYEKKVIVRTIVGWRCDRDALRMRWRCNENAIEMIMTLVIVMVSVETTIIDISDNDHNYGGERNIPPPLPSWYRN